jgi:pimeloyl-ACP methyl ester carboxylesterase
LSQPVLSTAAVGVGGAAAIGMGGGAADLGDIANSITAGARRLLNFTTYYQMKERAGTIGINGVAPVIRKLRQKLPQLRIHLVGHSFGGRVVTAAADAASATADKVNTLTLLQAAYSHNGLAQKFDGKNDGFFRKIVTGKKVLGPIVVTCTKNDGAVGIAYPLASRLGGQNAAALGDANDPYGGIGRNGAVKTPEAVNGVLAAANTPYQFESGHIYNLNCDAVIKDHSDICKPQVAWAMLSAVAVS